MSILPALQYVKPVWILKMSISDYFGIEQSYNAMGVVYFSSV